MAPDIGLRLAGFSPQGLGAGRGLYRGFVAVELWFQKCGLG